MLCKRCDGLLVSDDFMNLREESSQMRFQGYRCVNCGCREYDPTKKDTRTDGYDVESGILQYLAQHGSSTLEELARMLTGFTLNQVLFAVDRLSRDGRIILRHPSRFDYLVSAMEYDTHG